MIAMSPRHPLSMHSFSHLLALPYNNHVSTIGRQLKLTILFFTILLLSACADSSPSITQESGSISLDEEASVGQPAKDEPLQSQLPPPYTMGNIRFEHLTLEDGLSQNAAFSIIQDNQGFMWFGTQDGLDKYDGHNFTVYKHETKRNNFPLSSTTPTILVA